MTGAVLLVLFAVPLAAQSAARLDGRNVSIAPTTFKGRSAVQVVAAPDAANGASYGVVKDVSFRDGTIEVDLAGQPAAGAGGGGRGFIGIALRLQSDGSYEYIYLRPTNGRADDQVRRGITHLLKKRIQREVVRDEYLLTPDGVLHTGQRTVN